MNSFWLISFRIICILQLVLSIYFSFFNLSGILTDLNIAFILQSLAFGIIALLPLLSIRLINNNYPDKPIEGRQKKNFNRIFLSNLLMTVFLFASVFSDIKIVYALSIFSEASFYKLDFIFLLSLIISSVMLIFHFIIMYGLYRLRNHITGKTTTRQFDFE